MSHTFTVRDKHGNVAKLNVNATTRPLAAAWIDRCPDLTIVSVIKR